MNTKISRKIVSMLFASLVVVMLALSACIVDPNALVGTANEQVAPTPTPRPTRSAPRGPLPPRRGLD